jgi:hypothetical protein
VKTNTSQDHSSQGPARNIRIVNSHFTSGDLPTIQDWVDHVSDAMRLYVDDGPLVARCNEMVNVAMGFVVGGSHMDIIGNTIRNNITTRNLSGGENNIEIQTGEENLTFADWLALDLRHAPGSPAIDAGNPDGATTHDIDGRPRDAQPDIGAYEDPLP